ncbi:MAG: hypothetical protein JWN83_2628 [Chitinophagaceae bacterium]|nr:hypothetical protein [Chitinophagaceae bacterium]
MKNKFSPTGNIPVQAYCNYSKIFNNKWFIFLLMVIFATGCKKDIEEAGTTGVCPIVVSTTPVNTATGVNISTKIDATFNEAMNPATINTLTFTLVKGTTPIAGVINYSGITASFLPTTSLLPNTTYTATVTSGVKDVAGNAMINNYVWSFTTGAGPDVAAPVVTSTDPLNAATGVPYNKKISATFSEAMDSLSTTTSFTIANATMGGIPVTGSVTYSGTTAVFTPLFNLSPNTTYTATITTGAKDLAGNTLAGNYVWSFTTGASADLISPTVISTVPLNGATGVAFNTKVSATFSEAMDPSSINTTTFTLKQGATSIAGVVTYSGVTATFSPSANLAANTLYTATITTGAKDLAGNTLAANYVWSFTTGTASDVTPPTVISTDPANNATGVLLDKKVTANFSEAMDPLTINTLTYTLRQGATSVLGTVNYSGTTATFSPSSNLAGNTLYTATITTGAKDLAGNALVSNYVWSFTTMQAIVLVPPPSLGSISMFGAFGGNAGITNGGINTVINGSIGTTAASTLITGFHDGTTGDIYTETPLNKGNVTGRIYTAPPAPGTATSFAIAQQALLDATVAYNSISPASKPGGTDPGAGELGGLTLAPGVYKSASGTFKITNGDLVLDAKGDANAVWIFQTAAELTVGDAGSGARSVRLINGGLAKNVFWYVGSAATINGAGGGVMTGTIISSAGVTFSTIGNAVQTVLNGRAISLVASVTMVNTTINVPN